MKRLKQLFCGHVEAGEIRVEKHNPHLHIKKRHYRYCKKCDKRIYLD